MLARDKYRKAWELFAEMLKTGIRPDTFEEAWQAIPARRGGEKPDKQETVSGFYKVEAKAVWDIISQERVESMVEIGRHMGGSLFLWGCACQGLKEIASYDIESYEVTDGVLYEWFTRHGVEADIVVFDSSQIIKTSVGSPCDFVMIDGEHTGPGVKADIEIWQDATRLIAFHDFADGGAATRHKATYPDVIREIQAARDKHGWVQAGPRGRSDIVYRTRHY